MIGGGILGLILFILLIIVLNFGMTWIRAAVSGAKVTFLELIQLQLRKIPIRRIVDSRINAVKSGIVDSNGNPVGDDTRSTHFLAGGHVEMVIQSLINAQKANIDLTFDRACAIDLATKGTNKNVEDAVHPRMNVTFHHDAQFASIERLGRNDPLHALHEVGSSILLGENVDVVGSAIVVGDADFLSGHHRRDVWHVDTSTLLNDRR